MKAAATVLIVLGMAIVIWGGLGFKTDEKVFDAGPIHVTRDKEHHVPYGPLLGIVLAVGGVILLVKGKG